MPTVIRSYLASSTTPEENLFFLPCYVMPERWLNKPLDPSPLACLPSLSSPHSVACHSSSCEVFPLPEVLAQASFNGCALLLPRILGTSSTNTVGGTVNSQAAQAQPPAMTSSRKGTFTDDLHKLVDNWARDAMNLSGRRGSKGHMNYEAGLPLCHFPNLAECHLAHV